MAHRRWARKFSVLFALILWLCLGLALPIILSLYSTDGPRDALEAAPADAFTLTEPVVLSARPGIRLERGTIAFLDGNGSPLPSAGFGQHGIPQPSQSLQLFNATVAIGSPIAASRADPATQPFPASPFAAALADGRYDFLSLRRTTLLVHGFLGETEALTDVAADVSLRRRGIVAIKGSGMLRGRKVSFDVSAAVGQAERRGAMLHRLPVRLSLKGGQLDFNFDGRLVAAGDELELQGPADFSLTSGRAFARWLGAYWPTGAGLRDIAVRGQMRLGHGSIAFENAVARMDGNEATGVVGLRLKQPRPVLSGTLAYKLFDASVYLAAAAPDVADGSSWTSLAAGALTVPLGMHLDADMRISADRVQVGKIELDRVAATVALKDGRLLADVADMRLIGGEGGGQVTADFSGLIPKVSVRGKLEQVDLALMSSALAGSPLLNGRGAIVADLAGTGGTLKDVLTGFSGKLAVRAQTAGRIGLDFRGLLGSGGSGESYGWGDAARGHTAYDSLDMKLVLRDGTILTETAEARAGDATWSAVGVVNLLSDRIDVRLSRGAPGAASAAAQGVVELNGPLRRPRVKVSPAP